MNSSDCGFYFDLVVSKKVHGDYRETRKFMQLSGESGSKRSIIEGQYAKAKRFTLCAYDCINPVCSGFT